LNFELWDGCDSGGSPHPRSPSPKERGQCAVVLVVLCGGCKENFELGTSCKLAPAGGFDNDTNTNNLAEKFNTCN